MPEGPSIIILREEVMQFEGHKIFSASGSAKIDMDRIAGKKLLSFKTWGKNFLICFSGFTIKIHLLMFGVYLINKRKKLEPKLSLVFDNGELNFYTCSVKLLEGDLNQYYDWTADIMNENWDSKAAKKKLEEIPQKMICDALLEQDIFSGVGNIIKNEVLYRVKVHPESLIGKIPKPKITEIIKENIIYSFQFLDWKRKNELAKHWLAYSQKTCVRCNLPFVKKDTGLKKRASFFCNHCQKLYE
ncbi:endonuclease [Flavobacterium wongokense]|uniref:endonuclease n=1 Tax=Flavobacterium wongokense TaxID=2910674 RepID=UPI001F30084D|nr:endonuclease [Flavobacterium sp. WG47]MCF6132241.1 endonuclease [Flavobacterium sp. WG47]